MALVRVPFLLHKILTDIVIVHIYTTTDGKDCLLVLDSVTLFIGTRFGNLYTSVDTLARGRVVKEYRWSRAKLEAWSSQARHSPPLIECSFLWDHCPHNGSVLSIYPALKWLELAQCLQPPSDCLYLPVEIPHLSSRQPFPSVLSIFRAAELVTMMRSASKFINIICTYILRITSSGHEHQMMMMS